LHPPLFALLQSRIALCSLSVRTDVHARGAAWLRANRLITTGGRFIMKTEYRNGKSVLLIGGCGFVGSHVVDEFLAHGWRVVVFGKTPEKFRQPLPRVTYITGQLGDTALLNATIAMGFDCVVHLASSTVPSSSNADKPLDVRANLLEAIPLLDACVTHKVGKFIFASSGGTVYGVPKRLPIREDDPTDPICSYGIIKLAFEKYLHLYHQLHGLQYVVLRISNPYGPRQDPGHVQGVVSVFAGRLLTNAPITIFGNGQVVRDFIHVSDLARLFFEAAASPVTGTFNAGSGLGISISEILAIMIAQFGVMPKITRLPNRSYDVPATVLSCEKAKAAFGWKPQVGVERGIRGLGRWLVEDVLPVSPVAHAPFLAAEGVGGRPAAIPAGHAFELPLHDHSQTSIPGAA
jgi:UDP-glucose 4-epimerase